MIFNVQNPLSIDEPHPPVKPIQALQQLQALNGFTSTQVTTPQPQQPTANPYQGAGLSSATTATAQPASAVNLLTLQQLLAANGTTNLALANGAQGKQKSSILMGFS